MGDTVKETEETVKGNRDLQGEETPSARRNGSQMKRDIVKRTGKIVRDTGETVKRRGETGAEDGGPTEGAKNENRTMYEIW